MTPAAAGRPGAARRPDVTAGAAVTGLAALATFWFVPAHVNLVPTAGNDIAPAFMPLVCSGLALVLGIVMLVRGLMAGPDAVTAEPEPDEEGGRPATARQVVNDLAIWSASTVAIVVMMQHLSFIVTGGVLLAAWLAFAGLRSWPVGLGVVVILPAVLDWLCRTVLQVQLP